MDDPRPRLEKAHEGQHVFERELGGGGMSRTYLVRDHALDRRVGSQYHVLTVAGTSIGTPT